jgi:hypothetical protein
LGFPHPDWLLRSLTSKQISDWQVYYALEPFGEDRADWRQALTSLQVNHAFGGTAKMQDFMLHKPERHRMSADEMKAALGLG